jgi:hypothetical protein
MSGPASKLCGVSLPGGWTADKELTGLSDTGGNFSYGYHVTHTDGRGAFLKALDYSRALRSPDEVTGKARDGSRSEYESGDRSFIVISTR